MGWIVAGVAYSALYAVLAVLFRGLPGVRLWAGNIGLLLSPIVPILVIGRRRRDWTGRQLVFFEAIAVGATLWFGGQIAWATHELFLDHPQPWLTWDIVPQLCGALVPLLALIAAPHRGVRRHTAETAALDIVGVMFVIGFLCWALVIVPGQVPGREALGLKTVSYLGPAIRAAAMAGMLIAASLARDTPWAAVYKRIAAGAGLGLVFLLGVSTQVFAGTYVSGSVGDVGWILPFWFFAAAAADAPASDAGPRPVWLQDDRPGPPLLLFGAIFVVPLVMPLIRRLMPLGGPADAYREFGSDAAIVGGIALAMFRLVVEQRVARRYEQRVRLLAAAAEQTSELIVITRGDTVEYANAAFCRAVGYELADITTLGRHILVEADPDAVPQTFQRLRAGEPVQATLVVRRRDGTTFPAAVAAAPIEDSERPARHVVAVVRDLTEEQRVRDQLVRGERLSAVGELVSSIAHQINNPLQSMIGTVDVLLSAPVGDSMKPDLERVRLEAWRAGHIIRNLLAFARKAPGERLLGELNEIVQATTTLCTYDLQASRIRLETDLAKDLPLVLVNREEIQQAILNVIVNAQQSLAARGGGTVTLRTYAREADAALEVADDGPGVPPELASRVFEPFVTTKSLTEANGFGLSTAYGIVAAHGGTLELVSAPIGACFRMTLPGAGFAGPVVRSG